MNATAEPLGQQENSMFKLFAPLAVAVVALSSAPASAGPSAAPPTVRVAVADLDLTTPAGVESLDRRLATAIRRACPASAVSELRTLYDHHDCVTTARLSADAGRTRLLARTGIAHAQLAVSAR